MDPNNSPLGVEFWGQKSDRTHKRVGKLPQQQLPGFAGPSLCDANIKLLKPCELCYIQNNRIELYRFKGPNDHIYIRES